MNFAAPQFLLILIPLVPGLIAFFWFAARKRRHLMTLFVQARLLPSLSAGISPTRQKIQHALLFAAVVSIVIALARPQWGYHYEEVKQKGLDIVVAIDVSKSMLADDIAPNRLTRAKLAAQDLVQQAKSDRLGLVAFAGNAFLQCPLTLDDIAFKQSLDTLDVNVISQGGTAVAEAIDIATTAFKEGDSYKILVLFTDGEDNDTGAIESAQRGAKNGLKIFTVGIGTPEGELLRITDSKGRTDYVRDENGAVVKSHLNEDLLKKIALAGDGQYIPLRGAKAVETLYEKAIAPLPKNEHSSKLARQYHEQFFWFIGLAIMLLIIEMFLPERKRGAKPIGNSQSATAKVALLALLFIPALALASPQSALKKYESGNYDESLKEYHTLLEKTKDDARLHFNAGAAAFRNKEFDEAEKQFNQAITAQDLPLQQRAYYNLGNTFYELGDAATEPDKKKEHWEKALENFEAAKKLNELDADAKFNHEFVTRKLEELKKQQEQQQQQDKNNKDQKKNDKDQQGGKSGDSKDKQDNKDQQQSQNKDDKKDDKPKDPQQDEQQSKTDQQKQDEQKKKDAEKAKADKQKEEQKKKEQQSAQSPPDDKSSGDQTGEEQPVVPGQMTAQQARQLLDAQKGQEQVLVFKPTGIKTNRSGKTLKDW